ncbi:flippase, partial [Candidatus Woesearchaeota archaeon]|nr:flippase [Candidatus Woesearchaeota archaeon]
MINYKKYAKDVVFIGIAQILAALQSFLILPILTKFLGAAEFGVWSQIKITVFLLTGLSLLGMQQGVIRFMSGENNKNKLGREFSSVFIISLFGALFFGLVIFFFSDIIGLLLTDETTAGFFFKFVILMILARVIYNFLGTFIKSRKKMKLFSIIEMFNVVAEILLIYFFLLKGFGLLGVIIAFIAVRVILIIVLAINIRKHLHLKAPNFKSVKHYFSFSLPLTVTPILFWIIQSGDQYVIGFFNGAAAVGIYALAYALCRVIRVVADPIILILQPSLASSWNRGKIDEVKMYFKYSYKYIFMLSIPVFFGLTILAEPIIKLISTGEFITGKLLIPIIGAGVGFYILFILAIEIFMLRKETKKLMWFLVFLTIFNVVLNIILVPWIGNLGAAISTLLSFLIAGWYGALTIRKAGFSLMPKFIIKCFFSASVMGLLLYFMGDFQIQNVIFKLFIIILISVVVYFLLLYLLKGITKLEINF